MIKQKRSLGQIFLKDKRYIQKILNQLSISKKTVVEIGPGTGEISALLAKQVRRLYCVEIDSGLYNILCKRFCAQANIEIIRADILDFALSKLGKKIIVFGNVPYYISSQLIEYLICYHKCIDKAYLTFQKEFAQKLLAEEGQSQYTFLSCHIQYYAKVKKMLDIPAGAFDPHPKVDSSFINLKFRKYPLYKVKSEKLLFRTIRTAFSNRRKKIINSLPISGNKADFFSQLKIDPDLRPQNLSLKEYVLIANKLYQR